MSPMSAPLSPPVHVLRSGEGRLLARELHIAAVREQAAIVRAFLDEVERLVPRSVTQEVAAVQVVEELTGLGLRILEAAEVMAKAFDAGPSHRATAM